MARNDVCSADTQADDIATSRSLHNHQHDSLSTSEVTTLWRYTDFIIIIIIIIIRPWYSVPKEFKNYE